MVKQRKDIKTMKQEQDSITNQNNQRTKQAIGIFKIYVIAEMKNKLEELEDKNC